MNRDARPYQPGEDQAPARQEPTEREIRMAQIIVGGEKVHAFCRFGSTTAVCLAVIVAMIVVGVLLTNEGVRQFLTPMGWWLWVMTLPWSFVPALAILHYRRSSKVTRRSKELEKLVDPNRTSSQLTPGDIEE